MAGDSKAARGSGGGGYGGSDSTPADDPWGSAPPTGHTTEPPF